MSSPENSAARISQLEADLLRLRRRHAYLSMAVIVSVIFTAMAFVTRTSPGRSQAFPAGIAERVDARLFVLRGARGEAKATLGIDETDGPQLLFLDSHGRRSLEIGIRTQSRDIPGLELRDEGGQTRLALTLDGNGPSVELWSASGARMARLYQTEIEGTEAAYLAFAETLTKAYSYLGLSAGGHPRLALVDDEGKVLMRIPAER
jgi:hypothetical protein